MRRIAFMMLKMLFTFPYYVARISRVGRKKPLDLDEGFRRTKIAVEKASKAGRVTIEYTGVENVPEKNGYIFYPNHQGLFDMLVFFKALDQPISFIMKKEVRKAPFVKQVASALGGIPIDREDLRQSMQVINQITEDVKNGRNYLIFPEGTRNRNKNIPGEFKAGSFKAAVRAKAPIIPCALYDAYIPFDEKHIRPTTVKLAILKPMYYEEYKDMTTIEIAKEVKGRIVEQIDLFDKEKEEKKN